MPRKFWKKTNDVIRKTRKIMRISVVVIIIATLIGGYFLPQDVTIYDQGDYDLLDSGWTQIVDGESVGLNSIEDYICLDENCVITIQRVIDDDMLDKCILFYAEHQEVLITIDDEVVYSLTCIEELKKFESPGRTWVSVPISQVDSGKTLTITLYCNFSLYAGIPSEIYCVVESAIVSVQTNFLALRNTLSIMVIALALISYLNANLWESKKMRRILFSMADLYLFIGLWLCAEVNIFAIWVGRATLSAIMAMIFLRVVPIAFYYFFMSMLPYESWRTQLASALVWLNFFFALIAQCFFGISLIDTLGFNVVIIVIVSLIGIYEIYYYYKYAYCSKKLNQLCYFTILLFIATLIECYLYLNYQTYGTWIGLPLTIACIVYSGVAHIILVSTESETDIAKKRLEKKYNELNKKPLEQQINAHFLYNSLNTISAYCQEEPQKAYDSICLLGNYMRAYTHLVNANEYVTLDEEIDLIHNYMEILNMRYDDKIKYNIVNNCEEVWLPALTLQPLVENAVNHGIRKDLEHGKIDILVDYRFENVQILVKDNGVGFDPLEREKVSGVGLKNIKSRINALGGNIYIESKKGAGTTIKLIIPIENEELEVDNNEDFIC